MTTEPTTPEPTLPSTASGAGGTGDQQAVSALMAELDTWKKRFTGLQPLYQKEQSNNEALKAAKFDLDQKLTSVTGENEARKLELKKVQDGNAAILAELESLKAVNSRMQMIVTEFPSLVEYETKGLLPSGQGDEFKAKLATFASLMKAQGTAAAREIVAGSTPPAPVSGGVRIAKDILSEATAALRSGNLDQYNSLYDEYLKAKA